MDELLRILIDKGPIYLIATGAICLALLLIHYILKIYERRLQKFDERFDIYDSSMKNSAISIKTVSAENIQEMKLEANLMRIQLDTMGQAILEFKAQVTKEMVGLKQHSSMIHERSENIKTLVDESLERVGRFLALKEKVDMTSGNLTVLDVRVNRQDVHHRQNMATVAEALGKHAVEIANLKKGKKNV